MVLIIYGPSLIKKRNMAGVGDTCEVANAGGMVKTLAITIDKIQLFGGNCI